MSGYSLILGPQIAPNAPKMGSNPNFWLGEDRVRTRAVHTSKRRTEQNRKGRGTCPESQARTAQPSKRLSAGTGVRIGRYFGAHKRAVCVQGTLYF